MAEPSLDISQRTDNEESNDGTPPAVQSFRGATEYRPAEREIIALLQRMHDMMARREQCENPHTSFLEHTVGPVASSAAAGDLASSRNDTAESVASYTPSHAPSPVNNDRAPPGENTANDVPGVRPLVADSSALSAIAQKLGALSDAFLEEIKEKEPNTQPKEEDCNARQQNPFPRKRFALKKELLDRNPVAASYDYEVKYPLDERYHELDENARVWHVYHDEAVPFDNDLVGEAGDSLDILLVFAGLFAAVLTTFVAETSDALMPDGAGASYLVLVEVASLLRAGDNVTAFAHVPTGQDAFSPSTLDLWVNGLWFTSLVVALSVALIATLAKQWLRQYMSYISGTPRERAFIRQFRFDGLTKWRVQSIIGFLPVLLHASLALFLVGLALFLIPLSAVMASVAGVISAIAVILYVLANVSPLFNVQCPFRTPFSDLLYYAIYLARFMPQYLIAMYRWYTRRIDGNPHEQRVSDFFTKDLKSASTSLKELERSTINKYPEGGQNRELRALWWLAETTSNPSARVVVHRSLGAFTSDMSPKLADPEAMEVFYGLDNHYASGPYRFRVGDEDFIENIARAYVHLSKIGASLQNRLQFPHHISDPQVALALFASDARLNLQLQREGPYTLASKALNDKLFDPPPEVPELVWGRLYHQEHMENHPSLELGEVPYETLLAVETANWFDDEKTPYPLSFHQGLAVLAKAKWKATGITMGDVWNEAARRRWGGGGQRRRQNREEEKA